MGPELNIDIHEKRFAGLEAPLLADFRLDIAAGTIVALVGPSGVGKSTLLRMIAGIDSDFSGRISIGGTPSHAASPAGYVFQDARLLPWLTASENIRAVRQATTRHEARALLARVGLTGSEAAYPRQLSGGMQRRVGLARALSVNSGLLLLDEPFVSLDRLLIRELQALFVDVVESEGATAVLVTHMPEDAAVMADRAIVLGGRPARIVSDIALATPRRERDAATMLRLTELVDSGGQDQPGI